MTTEEPKTNDPTGTTSDPPSNATSEPPKTTEPPKSDSSSSGLSDDIRKEIREAVADALKGSGTARPVFRREDQEALAEQMVKEAAERVAKEKQHEEEHKKLSQPPVAEDAPKTVRKLTKILWGEDK